MRHSRFPVLLLATLLTACSHSTVSDQGESSVRPGINQAYFDDPKIDHWVQRFEVESREIYAQRRQILEAVGLRPGMAVADVGAGTGLFTRLFATEVTASGQVYAVDILPTFLEHIEEECRREGIGNVRVVLGRSTSVELAPASVDLVFVCDTYHHFEYPRSMLASIHEALRPGGALVVVDFIRIEGQSRPWVLEHVRAGEEVVTAEIESAGFEKVLAQRFLRENYFLRFRRI